MTAFISIYFREFSIIFAAQVRLENANTLFCVPQDGINIFICSETVPCSEGPS